MPNTLQDYLANATHKASADLMEAYGHIPEDKRDWSPDEKARTSVDLVAECALLAGYVASVIQARQMPPGTLETYDAAKTAAKALPLDQLQTLLEENTQKVMAAIRAVSDADWDELIELPWRKMTVGEISANPHWNMTYHQGQINYIASVLGRLE